MCALRYILIYESVNIHIVCIYIYMYVHTCINILCVHTCIYVLTYVRATQRQRETLTPGQETRASGLAP